MNDFHEEDELTDDGKVIHRSHTWMALHYLLESKAAKLGLFIIVAWAFVAVFAPLIAPVEPNSQNLYNRLLEPMSKAVKGDTDFTFILGSDS